MKNIKQEMREKFEKFGKQISPNNQPASFDEIADFWLSEFDDVLRGIVEEFNELSNKEKVWPHLLSKHKVTKIINDKIEEK